MTESPRLYECERTCSECGERFWGTTRASCCSSACYSRRWRARQSKARAVTLSELCAEVLRRSDTGSAAWSKVLPRLFRQTAAELRRLGWDPIHLLLSIPTEPATDGDTPPERVAGQAPERRRWVHSPERELELLTDIMERRHAAGKSISWHQARARQLLPLVANTPEDAEPNPKAP